MVKPLTFKGDKKSKKRKLLHTDEGEKFGEGETLSGSTALTQQNASLETDEDDSWVSAEEVTDITGPIIITLASKVPKCLACDANGKVFPSELENVVEGDLRTAEPHDVRQVWIANRAAGTETFSLKGHHGRSVETSDSMLYTYSHLASYLSCDKFGLLYATREAISPEESFSCIPIPDETGAFNIQTVHGNYLTLSDTSDPAEIRGDAEAVSSQTKSRIRMQARFKPKLKKDKEQRVREKITKKELEEAAGRSLEMNEVKTLKRARLQGNYHEAMLDVRAKGKHDKYT